MKTELKSNRATRSDTTRCSAMSHRRMHYCRTRPYHDRKVVAKTEVIESVGDQFPMLPSPYKSNNTKVTVSIASSSSLPESIVHAEWVEPEQVQSSALTLPLTGRDPSYSDAIRRGTFGLATHCERSLVVADNFCIYSL